MSQSSWRSLDITGPLECKKGGVLDESAATVRFLDCMFEASADHDVQVLGPRRNRASASVSGRQRPVAAVGGDRA